MVVESTADWDTNAVILKVNCSFCVYNFSVITAFVTRFVMLRSSHNFLDSIVYIIIIFMLDFCHLSFYCFTCIILQCNRPILQF